MGDLIDLVNKSDRRDRLFLRRQIVSSNRIPEILYKSNSSACNWQSELAIHEENKSQEFFSNKHLRMQSFRSVPYWFKLYRTSAINALSFEISADSIVKWRRRANIQRKPFHASSQIECCLPVELNLILRVSRDELACWGNWFVFC